MAQPPFPPTTAQTASAEQDFFLPELCRPEALLGLVLMAELLVLVLVLAEPVTQGFDWLRLALTSLFVQWVVLLTAATLCRLRRHLLHLNALQASLLTCALVLVLTLLCTAISHHVALEYLGEQLSPESLSSLYLRHGLISLMMSAIVLRVFYLQSESKRQQQAELHARLQALQARIQPHFLFNSLNSIASLTALDPEQAEQALLDLSDLFRAALSHPDSLSTWQQEVQLAKQYLSIEQYRLADRLQVHWDTASLPSDMPMPHLTLQPLLENAIVHGIQPRIDGGSIRVHATLEAGIFELCMRNPLAASLHLHKGTGTALANIRQRLLALFGPSATLITEQSATEFIVRIRYACTPPVTEEPKDYEHLNR